MTMTSEIKISKGESAGKFFIPLDGKEAHLKYRMRNENTIDYFSTFVPPQYRGKSYGEDLVTYALVYARKHNLKVIVTCPFIKEFLSKNEEEYKDLDIEK